jgi:hypothetical protein
MFEIPARIRIVSGSILTPVRPGTLYRTSGSALDLYEMADQARLRRLVVVGTDHERPVGAPLLGPFREVTGRAGKVRAGSGQHERPSLLLADAGADQFLALGNVERRGFPGAPGRHEATHSPCEKMIDQPLDGRLIQGAIAKRTDHCDRETLEHAAYPFFPAARPSTALTAPRPSSGQMPP